LVGDTAAGDTAADLACSTPCAAATPLLLLLRPKCCAAVMLLLQLLLTAANPQLSGQQGRSVGVRWCCTTCLAHPSHNPTRYHTPHYVQAHTRANRVGRSCLIARPGQYCCLMDIHKRLLLPPKQWLCPNLPLASNIPPTLTPPPPNPQPLAALHLYLPPPPWRRTHTYQTRPACAAATAC
jgi:hypothetical protein